MKTGAATGRRTKCVYEYVVIEISKEFVDYVKNNFNREVQLFDTYMIIFPAKENYMRIKIEYRDLQYEWYYLVRFCNKPNEELNTIEALKKSDFDEVYYL